MVNECANCEQARANPHWPRFTAQCFGCVAREIASGPAFHASRKAGSITREYRRLLLGHWPNDLLAGHALVKGWANENR
jgi:hypothetical protein